MATATKLREHRLGPDDHGRRMSVTEFFRADYVPCHQYELIDGRLYVSPQANLPQDCVDGWLMGKIKNYSLAQPEVVNHVTNKARVFVPGRASTTCPEPDLAAYRDFPLDLALRGIRWQDVHPILVGEILSLSDPDKDLIRNVELYLQVPSIKEYWIVDTRESAEKPTMQVRRRWGSRWRVSEIGPGEVYTTPLLPGFKLTLDPRR